MDCSLRDIQEIDIFSGTSFRQRLAANELQRGLWQLGCRGRVIACDSLSEPAAHKLQFALIVGQGNQETYTIAAASEGGTRLTIAADSEQALLYGVFDFLEHQGAFFGLDGDLYPLDVPTTLRLPDAGQVWRGQPGFATRGLLPWPDFLNCISVFNREDFRAYLEAMLRMRFNTLGIHVYGQRDKWVESFLSFEYGGVGHAAFTDTTATDRWGYLPQRTSRYGMSAAQYFDDDVFGSDATRLAHNPWEAAERAQALWREAFDYAEKLGIRTGVGFEPYQLPDEIVRACPPEVRVEQSLFLANDHRDYRFLRVNPESRTARTILETRLAGLLEAYPSVSYVYLWEDEFMNWASRSHEAALSVTPFKQAHDFLRRHAPDKRLVLAGWGGVARHFEAFHRALPEDVIFTCLSDQVGWDPIHEVFGKLESRERWVIPWLEDDPGMWFPQLHVERFKRDMTLAEQYGCQGILGIHWRHRILDPNVGYLSRRSWNANLKTEDVYDAYARTQSHGERAVQFGSLLTEADHQRKLLSTWTGEMKPDGHSATWEWAGDYSEAFLIERDYVLPEAVLSTQAQVIDQLDQLLESAEFPNERERLSYWFGQVKFLQPYAAAWQTGQALQRLIKEQVALPGRETAANVMREQAIPLWIRLLAEVREAVLAFQHTIATRNDLGMLSSLHNKFVRIATFRFRASLLEFLDELPPDAEASYQAALAPDLGSEARVFVPTRPTLLAPGESVRIMAVAPGLHEPISVELRWRSTGRNSWNRQPMTLLGRRTYAVDFTLPNDADGGIEWVVEASFVGAPAPKIVNAPPEGVYVITNPASRNYP